MNKSKSKVIISRLIQTVQLILGFSIAFLFGLGALVAMFDNTVDGVGFIIMMWIITFGGIVLIRKGFRRKKALNSFKKYVSYLSSDPTGSIEGLAAAMGTSQDVVTKNLEYMIKKGYFVNAHINKELNSIVIGTETNKQQTYAPTQVDNSKNQAAEYITLTCKNCGGINKVIKGNVCECEFCGSPIQ